MYGGAPLVVICPWSVLSARLFIVRANFWAELFSLTCSLKNWCDFLLLVKFKDSTCCVSRIKSYRFSSLKGVVEKYELCEGFTGELTLAFLVDSRARLTEYLRDFPTGQRVT